MDSSKTTTPTMCNCLQKTPPLMWKALFRVIAFFVITVTGGIVFSVVERGNAENNAKTKNELLESLRKEMEKKYNMTQNDFYNFTQRSNDALSLDGPEWSYFEGVRYAFETITTIGYGALAPSTSLGQGLCIIFAVFGIPIMILAFKSVGELISRGISFMIACIESKCFKKEPSNVEAKCTAVTCALMITMLLLGATMQIHTEDTEEMTFLLGFYFWFITFTTIGYGDYVPGHSKNSASSQNDEHLKKSNPALRSANIAFHITWTTLGLCVVSSVLNAVAEFIEKRSPAKRMCGKCCSCVYGDQEELVEMDTTENDGYLVTKNDSYRVKENDSSRIDNCDEDGKIQDENYHSVTYV